MCENRRLGREKKGEKEIPGGKRTLGSNKKNDQLLLLSSKCPNGGGEGGGGEGNSFEIAFPPIPYAFHSFPEFHVVPTGPESFWQVWVSVRCSRRATVPLSPRGSIFRPRLLRSPLSHSCAVAFLHQGPPGQGEKFSSHFLRGGGSRDFSLHAAKDIVHTLFRGMPLRSAEYPSGKYRTGARPHFSRECLM